ASRSVQFGYEGLSLTSAGWGHEAHQAAGSGYHVAWRKRALLYFQAKTFTVPRKTSGLPNRSSSKNAFHGQKFRVAHGLNGPRPYRRREANELATENMRWVECGE